MKYCSQIVSLIVLGLLIFSCDVIEGPFLENREVDPEVTDNPQNVLLIDFTGHTCKSCPRASRMIKQISAVYGERLVPVAIHLGYFAQVSGDKYSTDFNTPEGAELEAFYNFISFPIGLVNQLRKQSLSPYPGWSAEVAEYIEFDAAIKLEAVVSFDESSRSLTVAAEVAPMPDLISEPDFDVKLAMFLTESHIIAYQKDEEANPMDVPDYEHNHVFRTALGSVWGESIDLSGSSLSAPLSVTRTKILQEEWLPGNCSVIIFAYDNASMTVLQSIHVEVE